MPCQLVIIEDEGEPMKIGVIQVALAAVCFGFLGIFGKEAFQAGISIGELLSLRFSVAAILLFIGVGIFRPRLLYLSGKDIAVCALLGCLGYAVFSTLYFVAIKGVSVALASLLLYTFPVFVSFGAHFIFKERLSKSQWFALPITALGLAGLLASSEGLEIHSSSAVAAGLGAAFCYAIYILASSRLQKNIHPLTSAVYVISFSSLALWCIHRPGIEHVIAFNVQQWAIVIGIAVVCTILPLFLFLSGLQKLGNTQASLLSTIEPVTASLLGVFILGEALEPRVVVGGALVLTGIAVSVIGPSHPKPCTENIERRSP
jgi:drug/metabolite transporter (DMT)-like permease